MPEFNELHDGHLHCEECDTKVWCIHLAQIVADEEDSALLFWSGKPDEFMLQQPIFPSLNIFAEVHLIRNESLNAREVYFYREPANAVMVGYLHPGEGRATIRSMIFDWFTSEFRTTVFTCRSASHKPAQEAKFREMMSKDTSFLMARYAIWAKDACPACLTSTDQDFSDLVPDRVNTPSPFGS